MSHNISDRAEYDDRQYAKMRIFEIQAILENEDMDADTIQEYEAERAMLEKILNPITIKTDDTVNFKDQHEAMTGIYKLMNSITTANPNLRFYAIVDANLSAIITSDADLADANTNATIAEQVMSDDGVHNAYKGQETICPLCGSRIDYIDSSPDYLFWHCPNCHADGKEGKNYTPDGDVEFDGYHYDIHHHPEDLPDDDIMAIMYLSAYDICRENPNQKFYCFLDETGQTVTTTDVESDIEQLTNLGYTYIGYFRYMPEKTMPIENCMVGEEGVCPICNNPLTYPDQSDYYHPDQSITWHCPKCNAYGQEGRLDGHFDGCHYDVIWESEDEETPECTILQICPAGIKSKSMTPDRSEIAIKALLESFIDNYIDDCRARDMNNDEIHAEICQTLSGIFEPGNLTALGYPHYELTDSDSNANIRKGIHKLIVFKSEVDDCIDMVMDIQNWDENFEHEVDIAVHKWQNSDDEYALVIAEHLESVGYIFTLREDVEIYSDYS